MKLALILNVIDPKIGGVMIMGDRGTGKSTTIRALADLLPEMKVGVRATRGMHQCHASCLNYLAGSAVKQTAWLMVTPASRGRVWYWGRTHIAAQQENSASLVYLMMG